MVLGIISVIFGCLIFLYGFFTDPISAPQQTIQYLVYVCSTFFVCSGFICITIERSGKKNQITIENTETIPVDTTQKQESSQTPPQTKPRPGKTPGNIADFFSDDKIMIKAKELRRMYGKEMYVDYLNDKARELDLEGFSLTIDDVE